MSVNMDAIRNGIVANLQGIPDCSKAAYRTGNISTPALVVAGFDQIDATTMGRHGFTFTMLIQGLAGETTNRGAEVRLDAWLSPTGDVNVWSALESDRTLGGAVDTSAVTRCDGTQLLTLLNGTQVLGTTWHLQIEL